MPDATPEQQVAVVTGASRGIGAHLANAFAAAGYVVAACSYFGKRADGAAPADSEPPAADAAPETPAAEPPAGPAGSAPRRRPYDVAAVDVTDEAAVRRFVGDILTTHGRIDVLVNNAGVIRREPIEAVSREEFDRTLGVNLRAPFFLIQQMLPRLRDGGRIVNISSMGTRVAYPTMAAYAPAKAGIEALTRLLAVHLGSRGITVNAVSPGLTDTAMNPVKLGTLAADQVIATIALGRLGQPADVADVVAFVASDEARWVTGQCIEVSGGQRL